MFFKKSIKIKILLFIIPIIIYFTSVMSILIMFSKDSGSNTRICIDVGTKIISENVLKWQPIIEKYAEEFDVLEYVPLIMALTQQESGGNSIDIMQSSEGAFNTKYPKRPNGITDTYYSIWCGVQEFKAAIERVGVTSPVDIPNISLALQAYNYGPGFIPFAQERGGYSKPVADEFSRIWAIKMGWKSYGDSDYVPHVLQYYNTESAQNGKCYEEFISSGSRELEDVVELAMGKRGRPYIWGAQGPNSFDCSGLVYWAYKEAGFNHTRTTAQGYYNMSTIINAPSVGDLVFFRRGKAEVHHIGIYIGDGKMIHAPRAGDVVKIADLNIPYWQNIMAGYGRLNIN